MKKHLADDDLRHLPSAATPPPAASLPDSVEQATIENRVTKKRSSAKRMVQRHSPDRLLRRKVDLPGDITISAEKHKGRLVVRVESPRDAEAGKE